VRNPSSREGFRRDGEGKTLRILRDWSARGTLQISELDFERFFDTARSDYFGQFDVLEPFDDGFQFARRKEVSDRLCKPKQPYRASRSIVPTGSTRSSSISMHVIASSLIIKFLAQATISADLRAQKTRRDWGVVIRRGDATARLQARIYTNESTPRKLTMATSRSRTLTSTNFNQLSNLKK
jgi:hypothetical protein